MSKLQQEFGPSVILLTYHVDYWDYLGWKDTFSDNAYTERQKMYGQALGQDSIYTPEMIIQGEGGFTGSDLGRARREVAEHLQANRIRFELTLRKKAEGAVEVAVQLPPSLARVANRVFVVVSEDAQSVHVLRGENSGATMSGSFAVRKLAQMPALSEGQSQLAISLEPGWDPAKVSVAAFVQGDSTSLLAAERVSWL